MEYVSSSIVFSKKKEIEVPLHKLPVGKKGKVVSILTSGAQRRRLLDLGIIPDSIVKTERLSPSGNPIAYNIRGSVIALRKEETKNVIVKFVES